MGSLHYSLDPGARTTEVNSFESWKEVQIQIEVSSLVFLKQRMKTKMSVKTRR